MVHEEKPVVELELKVAEGTVIQGRVTRGPEKKPVADQYIRLQLDGGKVPEEIEKLKGANDKFWHGMTMGYGAVKTDAEGRFRFVAGPGEYALFGPPHSDPYKFLVDEDQEIVRNFHLAREEEMPFAGIVVDGAGKPVAGATLTAYYASARTRGIWFKTETGPDGRFARQRETQPMMVHVSSRDGRLAILAEVGVVETDVRFELRPTATAHGRLLDAEGNPIPGGVVKYGVNVHQGDKNSPFMTVFGGNVKAGPDGLYELPNLAQGAEWDVTFEQSKRGPWSHLAHVTVEKAGEIELGDTQLARPYVPSTREELVARKFRSDVNPAARLADARAEAKREYLRIMLVLTDPAAATTKELNAALADREDEKMSRAVNDYQSLWIAAKSADEAGKIVREISINLEKPAVPAIVILDGEELVCGMLPLPSREGDKIDVAALRAFLVEHMLPERDGEQALAEALARAQREGKRVFLQETATWCGPCRRLSRFIDRHRDIFDANYVWVKIDRERHAHGAEVMKRIRGERTGGIPWVVILDAEGKELGTSESPDGENYGFPSEPAEIGLFMKLLKSTAPRLSDDEAAILQKDRGEKPAPSAKR